MRLPNPPGGIDATLKGYFIRLIEAITRGNADNVKRNAPEQSLLLVSPNGTVYTVTVTDAGVLTTTKVYG